MSNAAKQLVDGITLNTLDIDMSAVEATVEAPATVAPLMTRAMRPTLPITNRGGWQQNHNA